MQEDGSLGIDGSIGNHEIWFNMSFDVRNENMSSWVGHDVRKKGSQ